MNRSAPRLAKNPVGRSRAFSRERPGDHNQALMELGALVCKPKAPECPRCPLQAECLAYAHGSQSELPVRNPSPPSRTIPSQRRSSSGATRF